MTPESVFSIIRHEREQFLNRDIEIVPGYRFNQYDTVQQIHLYYNSKFKTGNIDNQGDMKFFYNISKYRCDVATRALDVDTRDVRVIADESGDFFASWLIEQDLKEWMREKRFARFLNDVVLNLPIYGTVVAKKAMTDTGLNVSVVDLRNLMLNQAVDKIQNSWVHERHFFTVSQLRKKKGIWDSDAVEVAALKFHEFAPESYERGSANINQTGHAPFIEVVERYGEVEQEDGSYKKMVHIVAGFDSFETDKEGRPTGVENGVILFEEEVEEYPYREIHYSTTPGRWLGIGIVEELFDAQIRRNELANDKAKSMKISTKHVFQTLDEVNARNIYEDLENGDILRGQITPIANEERNLAAFNQDEAQWDDLADRMSFTPDIVRGQGTAATLPLGTAVLQTRNAGGVFDYKRENLGIFLNEIFRDFIVPQLVRDLDEEHVLNFTTDATELRQKFDTPVLTYFAREAFKNVLKQGFVPTRLEFDLELQRAQEKLQRKSRRFVMFPKGFIKNAQFRVAVVTDDESMDLNQKFNAIQFALQMIAGNPQLLQNGQTQGLLARLLESVGLSIFDLPTPQQLQAGVGAQGSIEAASQVESPQALIDAITQNEAQQGAAGGAAANSIIQGLGGARGGIGALA